MGERCREMFEYAGRSPILPRLGLPACQGAGSEIRMTPTVCVFNRTRESFLCLCAVATGASPLPPAELGTEFARVGREDGVWVAPCSGVYTVGTPDPIDLVCLDRTNRVIQLVEHLDPLQIVPVRSCCASILKARTRTIYSSRTRVGDELLICSPEEVEVYWKQFQVQTAWINEEIKEERMPCSSG